MPSGRYTLSAAYERGETIGSTVVDVAENSPTRSVIIRANPDGGLTIEGSVCYPNGMPCPFAVLGLDNRKAATAGPLGRFSFTGVAAGNYCVYVLSPGYSFSVTPNVAAGTKDLKIVLQNYAILVGTVLDAQSKKPVKDFTVAYQGQLPMSFDTNGLERGEHEFSDSQGKFRIEHVHVIPLGIQVSASGYAIWRTQLAEPVGGQDNLVDVELGAAASITGVVRNQAGEPLSPAQVSCRETTTTTDANGGFVVDGLPVAEEARLAVSCDGYVSTVVTVIPGASGPVEMILRPAGALRIRAILDGQPLQSFVAVIRNPDVDTAGLFVSAENGEAVTRSIPPGEVDIEVSAKEGAVSMTGSAKAVAAAGQETSVEIPITRGTSVLEGEVIENGAPVAKAHVLLRLEGQSPKGAVDSETDGSFRIEGLRAGEYQATCYIELAPSRQRMQQRRLTLAENESQRLVFEFSGSGRVSGRLTGVPSGANGFLVLVSGDASIPFSAGIKEIAQAISLSVVCTAPVTQDGTFSLDSLEPGVHTILGEYHSLGRPIEAQNTTFQVVDVKAGEAVEVNLTLP